MGSTTPLHWASCKGHLYILCDLLDFFGTDDVNSRDADGNCCLHLAASCDGKIDQDSMLRDASESMCVAMS